MNPKHNQFRVLGQRSISSSFVFRSSNLAKNSKDDAQRKGSNNDSSHSFSDFLDKKLQRNPVMPKILKGKSKPFKSPLGHKADAESIYCSIGIKKEEKEGICIDQQVFELFKHTATEKGVQGSGDGSNGDVENGTSSSSYVGEIEASSLNNEQEIRKRRNPFEDGDRKHTTRKESLVLGDDPKQKQNRSTKSFISNKKPRPLYNHYGSGCGWWDCDMEGVDTEAVGLGEIWEGVGSTTFGGI
ncbi:uncharacterized protein [Euphorbia lathyris]|uniref:uncharacterized protein n=1 Tax=Euphorbia lathyris TaxID=212925 RepID=UPI0033141688